VGGLKIRLENTLPLHHQTPLCRDQSLPPLVTPMTTVTGWMGPRYKDRCRRRHLAGTKTADGPFTARLRYLPRQVAAIAPTSDKSQRLHPQDPLSPQRRFPTHLAESGPGQDLPSGNNRRTAEVPLTDERTSRLARSKGANCCLTRRCTLRGRVAQMSGAELGFASIRCMSIREATTADFRSESFHSRICHRIDPLSGPRPRIDYQWPF
jgi:hypothetical protein